LELIILMNTLNGPNNNGLYEVLGWYLQSPLSRSKYTRKSYTITAEKFLTIRNDLLKTDSFRKKIILLELLLLNRFDFTFVRNWYFENLVQSYKLFPSAFSNEPIKINFENWVIEDWKHRILALHSLIKDFFYYKSKWDSFKSNDIEIKIIDIFNKYIHFQDSKIINSDWIFKINDLNYILN
jgi:hypothetical protein